MTNRSVIFTGDGGADIVLRALRADADRDALQVMFADRLTRQWNPAPEGDLDRWLRRNTEPADDARTWAIADPADDRLLGVVAVFDVNPTDGTAKIGYRTVPAERGRGVATAAVRAATEQAFATYVGLQRIALFHSVGNTASCRVATAAGFECEGTLRSAYVDATGQRHDEHVHARLAEPRPPATDTRTMLISRLRAQRRHVLTTLDGLDDAQLRTPVAPTSWAPLAVVHHLALDVERWWFTALVAGDVEAVRYFDEHPDGAWTIPDGTDSTDVFALYEAESARSDAIIAGADLDAIPAGWPGFLGRPQTVHEIVVHVIAETAAHAGQLDIVRESIDGTQWLVLD